MLYFIGMWLTMAIFADGYWSGPYTPWYSRLLMFVTTPLWFGVACIVLLHELGDKLFYWGE